jgi:hypothetical protein
MQKVYDEHGKNTSTSRVVYREREREREYVCVCVCVWKKALQISVHMIFVSEAVQPLPPEP